MSSNTRMCRMTILLSCAIIIRNNVEKNVDHHHSDHTITKLVYPFFFEPFRKKRKLVGSLVLSPLDCIHYCPLIATVVNKNGYVVIVA